MSVAELAVLRGGRSLPTARESAPAEGWAVRSGMAEYPVVSAVILRAALAAPAEEK